MKIFEVRFKIKRIRPELVEAAGYRVVDRATLEFYDSAEKVIKRFPAVTVKEVNLFSDPEEPLCSVT